MAFCLDFNRLTVGSSPVVTDGTTQQPFVALAAAPATQTDGVYTCGAGAYVVLTVAEVNTLPKAGVPDAQVMRETFFMSFGLVIGIWCVGKCVGAVLRLIKGEESEFS